MLSVLFLCFFIKIFQKNLDVYMFCQHIFVPFGNFEDLIYLFLVCCITFYLCKYSFDNNIYQNINKLDAFFFYKNNSSRYTKLLNMCNVYTKYLYMYKLNLKIYIKSKWKPLFKKMSYFGLYASSKSNKNN